MDELTKQRIKSLVEQTYFPAPRCRWLLPASIVVALSAGVALGFYVGST